MSSASSVSGRNAISSSLFGFVNFLGVFTLTLVRVPGFGFFPCGTKLNAGGTSLDRPFFLISSSPSLEPLYIASTAFLCSSDIEMPDSFSAFLTSSIVTSPDILASAWKGAKAAIIDPVKKCFLDTLLSSKLVSNPIAGFYLRPILKEGTLSFGYSFAHLLMSHQFAWSWGVNFGCVIDSKLGR